jgi:hypothetical protein
MRTFSITGLFVVLALGGVALLFGQTGGGNTGTPPIPSMSGTKPAGSKRGTAAPRKGSSTFPEATRSGDAGKKKAPVTTITVELLTGPSGVGIKARQWAEVLGKLDVVVTVRTGRTDDKLGVSERKTAGTLRSVQVVGFLDSTGKLNFPDQIFSEDDADKLAAWINELRLYGAQGDPNGRPVWGLTKEQFGVIHTALKKPLSAETKDVEITKAVGLFDMPKDHPVRFSSEAVARLKERGGQLKVSQSLQGVSQGTALAVLLAEQGLGFRPRRLPDSTIELTVFPLEEKSNVWPVGWPRENNVPDTCPELFHFKNVELDEEPLDEILEAVAGVIKVPILIDRQGLTAKGVDLAQVKITYPRKRTTWSEALKSFTYKAKCKPEVLIDEAGKPFIWITPIDAPTRPQKG